MKPHFSDQMDWVNVSVESPYGTIVSEWKNDGDQFSWNVEVPPNTTASLYIPYKPGRELSEGVHSGLQKKFTPVTEHGKRWLRYEAGSGVYQFKYK